MVEPDAGGLKRGVASFEDALAHASVDDAPVLAGRLVGGDDFRELAVKGILRKAGSSVRDILAELAA
jgi:hypothetical protein